MVSCNLANQYKTNSRIEYGCLKRSLAAVDSCVEFEGKEGAQEYFSQVGTQNLVNKGALEYFGRLVT